MWKLNTCIFSKILLHFFFSLGWGCWEELGVETCWVAGKFHLAFKEFGNLFGLRKKCYFGWVSEWFLKKEHSAVASTSLRPTTTRIEYWMQSDWWEAVWSQGARSCIVRILQHVWVFFIAKIRSILFKKGLQIFFLIFWDQTLTTEWVLTKIIFKRLLRKIWGHF